MSPFRRKILLELKPFLLQLSECSSASRAKRAVSFASDKDVTGLLTVLHLLVRGEVPVPATTFQSLIKKRLLKVLQATLERSEDFKRIRGGSRENKLSFLHKIAPGLPELTRLFIKN